jgi:hypothetical protein
MARVLVGMTGTVFRGLEVGGCGVRGICRIVHLWVVTIRGVLGAFA